MTSILLRFLAVFVLCASFSNVNAQLQDDDDEVQDEMYVYGTQPDNFGFASVGGWLSFAVVDFGSIYGAEASLSYALAQFEDEEDQSSEQMCQDKIETWRQDCHDTYANYQPVCILAGTYAGLSLITAILPSLFIPSTGAAWGTVTSMGCMQLTQRAHQWCDAMANSEGAPEFAECD